MQKVPSQTPREAGPHGTVAGIWLRRLPLLVILSTAILGAFLLRDQLDFDALARHQAKLVAYRDAHYLPSVLCFVLAYVLIVAFSLPGATIATLAGGFLFGLFPGVFLNVLGAGTGALLVFLAARAGFGADLVQRISGKDGALVRLQAGLRKNEWSVLFLMRLVPVVPFFLANLLPAAIGTSLWRFTVTTFLGIFPGALVFTSVGSGLGDVFARGEKPDLGFLFSPGILGPILGLAVLAALPLVLKAARKDRIDG
ncbi:MAG: TVP38/TMEM64 family protein [Tabrizicola sp.]|nr:TVP38/TMEM64 family protein [Tabrizicola sp.]